MVFELCSTPTWLAKVLFVLPWKRPREKFCTFKSGDGRSTEMHSGHKHESFAGSVELSVVPSWKVRGLLRNYSSKGKLVACAARCASGRRRKCSGFKFHKGWTASVRFPGEWRHALRCRVENKHSWWAQSFVLLHSLSVQSRKNNNCFHKTFTWKKEKNLVLIKYTKTLHLY